MDFAERKKKALQFEKKTKNYLEKQFPNYRLEEQKIFSSGKRPDYWLVSRKDSRDRVPVEVKYPSDTRIARESDLKQLRMYQHQGIAQRGMLIYPDFVRVPHELRREARESGQKIVKISEGRCLIATAAFGTPLANEIEILRKYRDRELLQSHFGKCLVRIYYKLSPPIASLVAKGSLFRKVVRIMIRCIIAQFGR